MHISSQGNFLLLLVSATVAALFIAAAFLFPSPAHANVFQFSKDDPNYARALAAAVAFAAEHETDVGEKIYLDENYQPEDFGIENIGFLPNNPFYMFKSLRRGVASLFTFDPVAQAELKLQYASEKLLEAKELAGQEGTSEGTIVRALDNYHRELAKVDKEIREAAGVSEERRAELLQKTLDLMTKYQKTLSMFDKALSPENLGAVQDARDGTAETFGAVFALGAPEAISEKLVAVLDAQSGSEFKHFKNAEVLKEVVDRVPLEAKAAIKNAEENVLTKLQIQLEQADEAQRATFTDFVKETGGNEVRHLEVVNELEVRPVSDEVRDAIAIVKEEVLAKTEKKLAALSPEDKEKLFGHLREGSLENVRIIKEIENNVAEAVLQGLERVRTQATAQLRQNMEEASTDETKKQVFNASIERFHDAKSISVLEEIGALIPEDKKEFFNSLKTKAAEEIKRDIDNARNASQRAVIYKSLAGDHPEHVAALDSFGRGTGISESVRGVLDGLRSAQYRRVEARAGTITDQNRLAQFEAEYDKYQTYFEEAPGGFNIRVVFDDKRAVFESPDRARQEITRARAKVDELKEVLAQLPYDVGFADGHFDPAMQEIARVHATAERKLNVAETSLEYSDIGHAYAESQTAWQMAQNGIEMARGYKAGRKAEKQVPDFLPKDFYQDPAVSTIRPSVSQGFDVYNASEFSQLCAFVGGFLRGKVRCEFADGRALEVPGGRFPFRVPPEFTPKKLDKPIGEEGKEIPISCPPLVVPAAYGDYCAGGKIAYNYDKRGCPVTTRCEYAPRPIEGGRCRGYVSESSCRTSGCVWYTNERGAYCDDAAHGRVQPLPATTTPEVKKDEKQICQAYFEGWMYERSEAGSQCVKRNASGCTDPFVYKTKEQCEAGQTVSLDPYKTGQSWVSRTWKFSDGSESSMILNRTDKEYMDFLASVDAQCAKIPKAKFAWKPGAGNDNKENWQSFGIPDCSGTAQNYQCGNNMCEMGETAQSCPVDCGGTGGTDSCSKYFTESTCTAVSECGWNAGTTSYSPYCALKSTAWKPQCSDGKDNDNDGKIDYPADPECYGPDDWDEWYGAPTGGGMKSCFYPNASINGKHPGYTVWCESDYVNCKKGDKNGEAVPTTGLTLGAPSSCESGWTSGSGGGCGMYTTQSQCTAMGGCRWDNSACSSTSGSSGYGSCANYSTQSTCTSVANCKWYTGSGTGDSSYCYYESGGHVYGDCRNNGSESSCSVQPGCKWFSTYCEGDNYVPPPSSSCASDQYWDSGAQKCMSSKDACIEAGGSWNGATNYCAMPTSTQQNTGTDYAKLENDCRTSGGTWDYANYYCKPGTTTTTTSTSGTTSGNTTTSGGMSRCFYPNASKSGAPYGWTIWCESDYVNCHKGSESGELISSSEMSSVSLGAPSSCESGWSSGSTSGSTSSSCPSGQYWNGSACVNISSSDTPTSCPSGQYWSGSACVTSSTSSGGGTYSSGCSSTEYWDGSACVPMSSSGGGSYSSCGANEYWDSGSNSCKSNSSACAEAGGTWDSGSNYCQMP